MGTLPHERLLSHAAAGIARDLEASFKRRLLPYHPINLERAHVPRIKKLIQDPEVARLIRSFGSDLRKLHLTLEDAYTTSLLVQAKWEKRALSPELLRRSENDRPALALAEAALRAGGFDDDQIGELVQDTRRDQRSKRAARVAARVRSAEEIPHVVRSRKILARVFNIE